MREDGDTDPKGSEAVKPLGSCRRKIFHQQPMWEDGATADFPQQDALKTLRRFTATLPSQG
jgi:hypothetical protein